ncbi:Rhodanese-related sulfurtransferase [Dickeya aquatica]|uniref:Rhodanese-related sulfurtransferase n=1 Tax=Dickeya aquatica TaxID=1401087 RepID=A0A375AGW9_9GAMM|nr:Rhodanese-related sulfurtransferase [Dickeya aquatica]
MYFQNKLALETDCADVHHAITTGEVDFVLLHVVGSRDTFNHKHLPGAIHLPHREITHEKLAALHQGKLFVVYCAGPHCNGADQAAYKIARLGFPVKVMIGGITGWADEGFAFASAS